MTRSLLRSGAIVADEEFYETKGKLMDIWHVVILCVGFFILGTLFMRWTIAAQFQKQLHDPMSKIRELIDGKSSDTTEHYAHMAQIYQDSTHCENQCGSKIAEGFRESEAKARAAEDESKS